VQVLVLETLPVRVSVLVLEKLPVREPVLGLERVPQQPVLVREPVLGLERVPQQPALAREGVLGLERVPRQRGRKFPNYSSKDQLELRHRSQSRKREVRPLPFARPTNLYPLAGRSPRR
jgi:hypothetical protein